MNLEEKILKSFKTKRKEFNSLDLIIALDLDLWEEERYCEIMEEKENGKVWEVKTTKTGNVIDFFEIGI